MVEESLEVYDQYHYGRTYYGKLTDIPQPPHFEAPVQNFRYCYKASLTPNVYPIEMKMISAVSNLLTVIIYSSLGVI